MSKNDHICDHSCASAITTECWETMMEHCRVILFFEGRRSALEPTACKVSHAMQQQVACWKEESKNYTLTFAQIANSYDKWHISVVVWIWEYNFVVFWFAQLVKRKTKNLCKRQGIVSALLFLTDHFRTSTSLYFRSRRFQRRFTLFMGFHSCIDHFHTLSWGGRKSEQTLTVTILFFWC